STVRLSVNTVGCQNCRPVYKDLLVRELRNVEDKLSPESRARIAQNPLRILDSKDEQDRKLTAGVPLMTDHVCAECRDHFAEVRSLLEKLKVKFEVDGRLVRGLDYYTKTAFEITSAALGSQDALAGGGRYDLLVADLGGKPTPGVGFAAGFERLIMALEQSHTKRPGPAAPKLFIVGLEPDAREWAFLKAAGLRREGIPVEIDYLGRSVKAQMREANRQSAEYVVVVGGEELASGKAALKHMASGNEVNVELATIESHLR
ncbi:MAG: ATP phosphoribosyltransferase regulatory subunit, partial [Bacteroidota bacterium]